MRAPLGGRPEDTRVSMHMRWLERLHGDAVFFKGMVRALRRATPLARNPTRVFPGLIDDLAQRHGDRVALISERETFTYRELAARSNRYTRWAQAQNLARGEVVCLLMPNRPEYLAIWIGITRAGGVVALLNTHLVGPSLAYCVDIVDPKHIIVAAELAGALASAEPHLATRPKIWAHGEGGAAPRIDHAIEDFDPGPIAPSERPALTIEDRALYIYTSGTTGMPKAANVNHYRIMLAACGFAGVMGTRKSDRMYDCLPMYHTTGGVIAIGALLVVGGSVVIREKFAATEFWDDVVRHDCTLFQYIGELCRYLVHGARVESERRHNLRLVCGNGLRPDLWDEFKERFRIPLVLEFYAATEGNVTLFNFEGRTGAVGRIPWFVAGRFPIALVKFDVEAGVEVRDGRGFCIRCAAGEIGETVGKIVNDPKSPSSRFEGYADRADDRQKILRNVFKPGDAWFRTGDLMRRDKRGFFYFVDRIGDTFRWKGENVATSEVAEAMTDYPGLVEANVYGVSVPGADGRAGMASIVIGDRFDLGGLRAHLAGRLPAYARPLFIRIRRAMDVTGTFKHTKSDLVRIGFDPSKTADEIYFYDAERADFVRVDEAMFRRIQGGQLRM